MTPERIDQASAIVPAKRASLFQLESELVELMALREELAEAGEDTSGCDQQIAEYVRREIKKVDGYRNYLRECEVRSRTHREEAKLQAGLAAIWEGRYERLKEIGKRTMEHFGLKRIEGTAGSLSLKGNGGLAPLVITDESLIPEECCDWVGAVNGESFADLPKFLRMDEWLIVRAALATLKRTPNNTRIREALKRGPVAGAYLAERENHMEIK